MKKREDWIRAYEQLGALWIHNGDARRPHAELTSGNHSNGFFNSRLVIAEDSLLEDAAAHLLRHFIQAGGYATKVECVVGPQTGATRLAEHLSNQFFFENGFGRQCSWASPAKHEDLLGKAMLFDTTDAELVRGRAVLLCEDVLTTGGSVELAAKAVADTGGTVLPFVLVLVNRTGLAEINGKSIVALIDHPMPIWSPEECPLCSTGSTALRPKEHWRELCSGAVAA